ncbi:MAG: DUF6412 domain-containing protein [Rhodococcus sp. (in: high G+C Gram-positive bacteria)]
MPFPSHRRLYPSLSSRLFTLAAALATTAMLLLVVVDQPGADMAIVGLVFAVLVAWGAAHAGALVRICSQRPPPPHEDRRLRGGYRRQHRPDTPGRPMPRAPGSVV